VDDVLANAEAAAPAIIWFPTRFCPANIICPRHVLGPGLAPRGRPPIAAATAALPTCDRA
jgi:hypothetical protein